MTIYLLPMRLHAYKMRSANVILNLDIIWMRLALTIVSLRFSIYLCNFSIQLTLAVPLCVVCYPLVLWYKAREVYGILLESRSLDLIYR